MSWQPWFVAGAILGASSGCVHARAATGATAELKSVEMQLAPTRMAQLSARFLIADAPGWGPGIAQLVVTLDDVSFGAVIGDEVQEGDTLSVPILLDLNQAPEDVVQRLIDGLKVRVGVHGTLEVRIQGQSIRFPVTAEMPVAPAAPAPPHATPPDESPTHP